MSKNTVMWWNVSSWLRPLHERCGKYRLCHRLY